MTLCFDVISIFPQYFQPLDLSLLGKAQESGRVQINVHDLRNWAEGTHRSVDDSPAGGGAGMVMRADVWGRAIDTVRKPGRSVLAIPTPSGQLLNQRLVERLAQSEQIVVACGRYEGIDARVAEHYDNVVEFSLGDYVLNGGEVAALALIEATARLQEGFMGNAESLMEESHSEEGLLEYPAYTAPQQWRGHEIPAVLKSGDHKAITRWRRDQSLRRTARRRPDLLASLQGLDPRDRQILAEEGWLLVPQLAPVVIEEASVSDIPDLAELAARTFPDACPPGIPDKENNRFLEENLSEDAFTRYLEHPDEWRVLVARVPHGIVAYTLTGMNAPEEFHRPGAAYLSKCYTDREYRGSGVTSALVEKTVQLCQADAIVLATNIGNKRAAKFYRRMGFRKAGRRKFFIGNYENTDDTFVRDLTHKS